MLRDLPCLTARCGMHAVPGRMRSYGHRHGKTRRLPTLRHSPTSVSASADTDAGLGVGRRGFRDHGVSRVVPGLRAFGDYGHDDGSENQREAHDGSPADGFSPEYG